MAGYRTGVLPLPMGYEAVATGDTPLGEDPSRRVFLLPASIEMPRGRVGFPGALVARPLVASRPDSFTLSFMMTNTGCKELQQGVKQQAVEKTMTRHFIQTRKRARESLIIYFQTANSSRQ